MEPECCCSSLMHRRTVWITLTSGTAAPPMDDVGRLWWWVGVAPLRGAGRTCARGTARSVSDLGPADVRVEAWMVAADLRETLTASPLRRPAAAPGVTAPAGTAVAEPLAAALLVGAVATDCDANAVSGCRPSSAFARPVDDSRSMWAAPTCDASTGRVDVNPPDDEPPMSVGSAWRGTILAPARLAALGRLCDECVRVAAGVGVTACWRVPPAVPTATPECTDATFAGGGTSLTRALLPDVAVGVGRLFASVPLRAAVAGRRASALEERFGGSEVGIPDDGGADIAEAAPPLADEDVVMS